MVHFLENICVYINWNVCNSKTGAFQMETGEIVYKQFRISFQSFFFFFCFSFQKYNILLRTFHPDAHLITVEIQCCCCCFFSAGKFLNLPKIIFFDFCDGQFSFCLTIVGFHRLTVSHFPLHHTR